MEPLYVPLTVKLKKDNSKLLLFVSVLVLVFLLILNYILKDLSTTNIWDYKKITGAQSIIDEGISNKDRVIYYELNEIIVNYINSYSIDGGLGLTDVTYDKYYDVLAQKYKKYLGKDKYLLVSKNFLEKFKVAPAEEGFGEYEMYTENVIKAIYKIGEETIYMCKVECDQNGKTGYIAIYLNQEDNTFQILYIE